MKRFFLSLSALAIGTISLFAQNALTKEYNFGKITSIEASSIYEIEVTQGYSDKVTIEYDEVFKDRLIVRYENGELELGIDSKQNIFKNDKKSKNGIKVYLQMPTIKDLELSGASVLKASGKFKTEGLDIDLSGASSISGLEIQGEELSVECSGASQLTMAGDFKNMELDCSGASTVSLNGDSNYLEGEFSGAVKAAIYGNHNNTEVICSGASKLTLEGETGYLKSVTSGASSLNAQEFTASNGYAEVTGASSAKVRCTGDLKIMVGKVSKLTHYGNPNIIDLNKDSNIKKGDE